MKDDKKFFRLGLFILGGIALAVAAILVLGAGKLFRPGVLAETYLNQSVQGLEVGSAVKYRGVKIGEVTKIGFTSTIYEKDKPLTSRHAYVYVGMRLYPDAMGTAHFPDRQALQMMIDRGLRFRMAMAGITGVGYLDLDFLDPKDNPPLPFDWTARYLYVPSAPSTVTQIINNVQQFLGKLDTIDFDALVSDLHRLVNDIDRTVNDVPMKTLSADLTAALTTVRRLLDRTDQLVASPEVKETLQNLSASTGRVRVLVSDPALDTVPKDVGATMAKLRELAESGELQRTLDDLQRLTARLDGLVASNSPAIADSLENLRQITDNLRDLTTWVKSYPAGALFGEPPKPVLPTK